MDLLVIYFKNGTYEPIVKWQNKNAKCLLFIDN